MKRMTCLLLLTALLLTLFCIPQNVSAAENEGLRYTIMVSGFNNEPPETYASWWGNVQQVEGRWTTIMTDVLDKTGRFIVIDEKQLQQDIGQMSTPQLLLKAKVTNWQETSNTSIGAKIGGDLVGGDRKIVEIHMTVYIVDPSTGHVIASTSIVANSKNTKTQGRRGVSGMIRNEKPDNNVKAITDAAAQTDRWLIDQLPKIPWSGDVALVKDGNIYINRGTREGVKNGQIFIVGQPDIIRDPITGEVLDKTVSEVARIKVITLKEKLSICQVLSGNDDAITKGMMIQPTN
jgi:hypothetical protein